MQACALFFVFLLTWQPIAHPIADVSFLNIPMYIIFALNVVFNAFCNDFLEDGDIYGSG
jgi:hypothetical protein